MMKQIKFDPNLNDLDSNVVPHLTVKGVAATCVAVVVFLWFSPLRFIRICQKRFLAFHYKS